MTTRILGAAGICALLALSFLPLSTLPAHAGTQDDIQSCREAMVERATLDMEAYRLSFKRKKGNSTRTLTLEAIPNNGGEKYMVSCRIEKGVVTEITAEPK